MRYHYGRARGGDDVSNQLDRLRIGRSSSESHGSMRPFAIVQRGVGRTPYNGGNVVDQMRGVLMWLKEGERMMSEEEARDCGRAGRTPMPALSR